ncbi:hypothetical protein SAMN05443432_10589 [Roseovarius litoreus]|uniref:Uncharacterized protein n=1 Tax=Roseovarius litoreus TaxID=1155722 RepID=A0A1M7GPX2_9RHOB|nr:hypothetical protein SAMN05443432_10589 [Roseovarius litoreus]
MRGVEFSGKTVVIAGAGCEVGIALAHGFGRVGARIVLMDREESTLLEVATLARDRIEPLALDPLRADLSAQFGEIWADEPLDILIHLQPLRHPDRLAAAMSSIPALTRDLARALKAGQGRVIVLFSAPTPLAGIDRALLDKALSALPGMLHDKLGVHGICCNALRLPASVGDICSMEALVSTVMFLCGPHGGAIGGALLPLWPRSD